MDRTLLDRLGPWPTRITWLLLPLLAGPALGNALSESSRPVQVVASIGMWGLWATALAAALIPVTTTLTVVRAVAPGPVIAVSVAAGATLTDGDPATGWQVTGLAWALVAAVTAFLPSTGAAFVNGSSYGDEVRLPLRVPGPLLLGPIPLVWAAAATALSAGPLLLAAEQWVPGVLALTVGAPTLLWAARVLHVLSRRWMVFVPGGVVLHDQMALADPVLFRRSSLHSLGPAPATTDALNLTRQALGLALEARFTQPVQLMLAAGGRPGSRPAATTTEADAILFTPTQPGRFLQVARARSLPVPQPVP